MVVIFTDGNIGNIQALYLLLSRRDISIQGIVVDAGVCPLDSGIRNVLQLLMLMERQDIDVYRGSDMNCTLTEEIPKSCSVLSIYNLSGDYIIKSHLDLMRTYIGDAISLSTLSTVAQWISNGSITSLTAFMGGLYPTDIGYYIYTLDPDAFNYVNDSDIPKKLWTTNMITQRLSSSVRAMTINNDILRLISKPIMEIILAGEWKFWDMVVVMNYLQYI